MLKRIWILLKKVGTAYVQDHALSRGAAMAFYAGTSLAPLLLIVTAIAGLVYGQDAARNAIVGQFSHMLGKDGALFLQSVILNASGKTAGGFAVVIGFVTLFITASGVFGEIQEGLNVIWNAQPRGTTLTRVVRARMASLGLVAVFGFLLLISLVMSAGISALSDTIDLYLPFGSVILGLINGVVSFALFAFLFAAIYKILPDTSLQWHEVWVGAILTTVLFLVGQSLISFYIGSTSLTSSYGAASAPIIILLWIYYSSQIFFLGAEFTKVYASEFGSHRRR